MRTATSKIVSLEGAAAQSRRWRAGGETVVFTRGVFDLMHVGHARYFASARALGTRLIVGVDRESPASPGTESPRPVLDERDRELLVAALRGVDLVVADASSGAGGMLRAIEPDVYVVGAGGPADSAGAGAAIESFGGRIAVIADAAGDAGDALFERVRERYRAGR